jgi:hypothetical protein
MRPTLLTQSVRSLFQVGDAAVASVALQPWRADAVRRTYDVALVDYGEGEGGDAQRHATPGLYFRRRGMKWANFAAVWRSHLAHLNYTAVWVVDDDIQMRVDAVNRMFAVFHRCVRARFLFQRPNSSSRCSANLTAAHGIARDEGVRL